MTNPYDNDVWQRRATANAILAVRKVVKEGDFPPNASISQLDDHELGFIASAVIFAWIRSRSEQATSQGWEMETALRTTGLPLEPWDVGAVMQILPELGRLPGLDWAKPIGAWTKDDIVRFLLEALDLVERAMDARDVGGDVSSPSSLTPQGTGEVRSDLPFYLALATRIP